MWTDFLCVVCVDVQQIDVEEDDDDDAMEDDSGDVVLGLVTAINVTDRQVLWKYVVGLFSFILLSDILCN